MQLLPPLPSQNDQPSVNMYLMLGRQENAMNCMILRKIASQHSVILEQHGKEIKKHDKFIQRLMMQQQYNNNNILPKKNYKAVFKSIWGSIPIGLKIILVSGTILFAGLLTFISTLV